MSMATPSPRRPPPWRAGQRRLVADGRPLVMGVVNVTPDSFSDGGRCLDPEDAMRHGLALVSEGADILDIGGESTRPGAAPVGADEELRRVLPVVAGLRQRLPGLPISIDTSKAAVAGAALDAGADARIERWLHAAPDHPVALAVPESEYLKGLLCVKA